MPTVTTITMSRGDDHIQPFVVVPAEDITGWTIIFTVARRPNSATKLFTKTCVHLVDADGTFKASISAADTEDLEPGTYFWDVTRTNSGVVRVLGRGDFVLEATARLPPS